MLVRRETLRMLVRRETSRMLFRRKILRDITDVSQEGDITGHYGC